jgi:hypothetical protein
MLRHPGVRPPDPRRLRLLALAGVVVCAVVLPLAVAVAGPAGDEGRTVVRAPAREAGRSSVPRTALSDALDPLELSGAYGSDDALGLYGPQGSSGSHGPSGSYGSSGPHGSSGSHGADGSRGGDGSRSSDDSHGTDDFRAGDAKAPSAAASGSPLLLGLGLATAVRCGPELTSAGGIEAQTCVLTQGEETWARTYYRNVTGEALSSVLSLMGPGGRTVQMKCAVGADDEPGMCETPREHVRSEPGAYSAVAEFARRSADGPLLLRSGSNSR